MQILLNLRLAACGAAAFIAFGPGAAWAVPGDPAVAATPVAQPGVWQEHRYSFVFIGFTSTYSCDGLADKLKLLLLAAGARADATVRAGACASGFGQPDKFARAELIFHSLTPAAAPDPAAPATVAGAWRPVALAAYHPRELRSGDCELLEQFNANVLSMFTTRSLVNNTTCIPHQDSGSNIDLRFDAFTAVQQSAAKPKDGK